MPSLRDLQRDFSRALLYGDGEPRGIVAYGRDAPERLGIYRNNVRETFTAALAATYPVLQRLTGDAYFRQLAAEYQRACPSRSGNLYHVGERLPAFLAAQYAATPYDYFGDVARLEWACEAALAAADAEPPDTSLFAELAPDACNDLCLQLHPSVSLVRSPYPILAIWQANQPDARSEDTIDLQSGGDCVLVRRASDGDGLELQRLSPGACAFLESVRDNARLGAALEAALEVDEDFDLVSLLGDWVARQVVIGWFLEPHSLRN